MHAMNTCMEDNKIETESNIDISIVEDDAEARRIWVDWLNGDREFRCLSEYGSAESAMLPLQHEKPAVVLMDINLPNMSGTECVRHLKPLMPETQFIMLTVYEDTDHIFDALTAGASGYLLKRTPRNELLTALKDVHAGGSPMTSSIARKVVKSFHQSPTPGKELAAFSPREKEVLGLLTQGLFYKEIADTLGISVPTVNSHIRKIYEKLHVQSRGQAVAKYKRF